eukprot:46367-Pleurochrysis_carterae.AAC.3
MIHKWYIIHKRWDGYKEQATVLIEDFDRALSMLGHHMKIWADRYSFLAECKGKVLKIRPCLIIVTSNYHPSENWRDQPQTLPPILRRFKCVEFKVLGDTYQNTERHPGT